jgi:hypothetical protein
MQFDLPVGLCTKCKEDGIDLYATWSKNGREIVCSRGHAFYDPNDFGKGITKTERKKLDREGNKIMNKLLNNDNVKGGDFSPDKGDADVDGFPVRPPAKEVKKDTDISIDETNKERLESLLGDFNDASSLVGRVFAMNEERKDLQDLIRNAKKMKVGEDDGKVLAGGDLEIKVIIPERHALPIVDFAHSWSSSVTRYINERIAVLLDDMLFYSFCILSSGIVWKIASIVHVVNLN